MHLFILRHGEAQNFAPNDAQRQLTQRGEQEVEQTLLASLNDMEGVNCIYASPYIRAQQTAQIASRILRLPVTRCDQLVPDTHRADMVSFIESLRTGSMAGSASVTPLLVSHQPLVGGFVDWLCGLEYGRHVMGTSALASIEADLIVGDCGTLRFIRQP